MLMAKSGNYSYVLETIGNETSSQQADETLVFYSSSHKRRNNYGEASCWDNTQQTLARQTTPRWWRHVSGGLSPCKTVVKLFLGLQVSVPARPCQWTSCYRCRSFKQRCESPPINWQQSTSRDTQMLTSQNMDRGYSYTHNKTAASK